MKIPLKKNLRDFDFAYSYFNFKATNEFLMATASNPRICSIFESLVHPDPIRNTAGMVPR
jgi:hypothetical protein